MLRDRVNKGREGVRANIWTKVLKGGILGVGGAMVSEV